MHCEELANIWTPIFLQLGCRESEPNNWYFETEKLIIVLTLRVTESEKDFFIQVGILFKKLHNALSLEMPLYENHDIGQGLYILLVKTGELEYYLDNLICYRSDINTDDEIINNSAEIARLFEKKVIPLIEEVDSLAGQAKDFEVAETWKPFLKHFRAHYQHDIDFEGKLEKYYREAQESQHFTK